AEDSRYATPFRYVIFDRAADHRGAAVSQPTPLGPKDTAQSRYMMGGSYLYPVQPGWYRLTVRLKVATLLDRNTFQFSLDNQVYPLSSPFDHSSITLLRGSDFTAADTYEERSVDLPYTGYGSLTANCRYLDYYDNTNEVTLDKATIELVTPWSQADFDQ